jgi:hypothetical protein
LPATGTPDPQQRLAYLAESVKEDLQGNKIGFPEKLVDLLIKDGATIDTTNFYKFIDRDSYALSAEDFSRELAENMGIDWVQKAVTDNLRLVATNYPDRMERLNDVRYALIDGDEYENYISATGLDGFARVIFYDPQRHQVNINKRLIAELRGRVVEDAQEYPDRYREFVEQMALRQFLLHEMMHAISFNKIEFHDNCCKFYSGVQTGRIDLVSRKRELKNENLNEMITDHLSAELLLKDMRESTEDEEMKKYMEDNINNGDGFALSRELQALVGPEIMRAVYLDGNGQKLWDVVEKRGINPRRVRDFVNNGDYQKGAEFIRKEREYLAKRLK